MIPDFVITPQKINVDILCIEHSPTGFSYGYGGSGPADLALNILETILRMGSYWPRLRDRLDAQPWAREKMNVYEGQCTRLAYRLHQDYKWQFIATLPPEGGAIKVEDVVDWIVAQDWRDDAAYS